MKQTVAIAVIFTLACATTVLADYTITLKTCPRSDTTCQSAACQTTTVTMNECGSTPLMLNETGGLMHMIFTGTCDSVSAKAYGACNDFIKTPVCNAQQGCNGTFVPWPLGHVQPAKYQAGACSIIDGSATQFTYHVACDSSSGGGGGSKDLSTGDDVGVAVGCIAGVGLVGLGVYYARKSERDSDDDEGGDNGAYVAMANSDV